MELAVARLETNTRTHDLAPECRRCNVVRCVWVENVESACFIRKCVFLLLPAAEGLSSAVLSQTLHSCSHIHYNSLEALFCF